MKTKRPNGPTKPKIPSRRDLKENSAVDTNYNLYSRREELTDIAEYFHTLSPKDQEWMNSYAEEFVNANFDHKKKKILTKETAEKILRAYIKRLKKGDDDKKVQSFVKRFLLKKDTVPIEVLQELFFETDEEKILKLVKSFKSKVLNELKSVSVKKIRAIIKGFIKESYDNNNARNRCTHTNETAQGALNYLEEVPEDKLSYNDEDLIIDRMDKEKSGEYLDDAFDKGDENT